MLFQQLGVVSENLLLHVMLLKTVLTTTALEFTHVARHSHHFILLISFGDKINFKDL